MHFIRASSLLFIILMSVAFNASASEIIAKEQALIEAQPYLVQAIKQPNQSLELEKNAAIGLPVKSSFTPGNVQKHSIDNLNLPMSFFIIGDDDLSKAWLVAHQKQLKEIAATGFITNVERSKVIDALIDESGLPILPVVIDELMALLKVNHYPLVFYKGDVWQ